MSQLDEEIARIKEEFDVGVKSKVSSIANNYHSKISRAKKKEDFDLVLKLSKEARKYPAVDLSDPSFKKLSYVRYADDWVIGIKGTLEEAKSILQRVKVFLDSIDLNLSDSKTKITDISTSEALFLGTNIKRASQVSFSRPSHTRYLKRNSRKLRLEAPIRRILKKLQQANFLKGGKPSPKFV
jgi:hypothetical protein